MTSPFTVIVGPGFFTSAPVHTAMIIGGGAAVVCAAVGVFTVIRGQSFGGHALADVSSAGGSASFLLGVNPLLGFLGMALLAAFGMELAHIRRPRERDLVTGIVLGAGLGLSALFLYLDVTTMSTTGAAVTVMFGSMFAISPSIVPLAVAVGAGALAAIMLLYRPLLLSSLDPELAAVRGVPVRLISLLYLFVLALAVSLSAITVGAVLSTALLIGPAATALRMTSRPGHAVLLAPLIGLAAVWAGILLAYDSYYWTPGHGWPVSFFIVTRALDDRPPAPRLVPLGRHFHHNGVERDRLLLFIRLAGRLLRGGHRRGFLCARPRFHLERSSRTPLPGTKALTSSRLASYWTGKQEQRL